MPSLTEDKTAIQSKYPGSGLEAYLSVPELQAIIERALTSPTPPTPQALLSEIQGTSWYKSTPDAGRSWWGTVATDPASASQTLQQQQNSVQLLAQQLGFPVDNTKVVQWSLKALQQGLNADQIKQMIVRDSIGQLPLGQFGGQIGSQRDQVVQTAKSYGVPLSDDAVKQWTTQLATGAQTVDGIKSSMENYAKGMYSWLAPDIDNGASISQIADPYGQIATQMGVLSGTSDFDISDPKWNRAINSVDPQTNQRRSLTLSEWQNVLRTDPQYGYLNTTQAKGDATTLANGLGQKMGALG